MLVGRLSSGQQLEWSEAGGFAVDGVPTTLDYVRGEDEAGRIQWYSPEGRDAALSISLSAPASPSRESGGWFSRLKGWQKALFVILWPISGGYGLFWMWKRRLYSQVARMGLTAVYALALIGATTYAGAMGSSSAGSRATTAPVAPASATSPAAVPASTAAPVTPAKPAAPAPAPTPAGSPADLLLSQINQKLGATANRANLPKISEYSYENETLSVTYAIDDNLSQQMIADGARIDATRILELTQESKLPVKVVRLRATYSMVDKLGNASEQVVVNALYPGATVAKVNFENFLFKNVWKIADSAVVHPEFQ